MKSHFDHLMSHATSLVRSGQLKEATAAIQAALGRGFGQSSPSPQAHDDDTCVIDIDAREIRDDARPARAVPASASAGSSQGQFIVGSHSEKSGTRAYKLYIPPQHQPGQALPLVVMLHGCTQDPDDFAVGTGMNEAARQQGFFVLYPAQAQNANSSRCWNWFKHNHQERGRGEPAILAGMTREVMRQHGIDPQQVYVAGLSAGGAMAAVLGEAYPDLYAAVGVHSGLPVGAAKDITSAFAAMQSGAPVAARSAKSPPTIVFHGDRDSTVHPLNGERAAQAGRTQASRQTTPMRGASGRSCTLHVYSDADGRAVAEHWVVHGAGHAWSGGNAKGSYTDPKGPCATTEMLRFFKANVLADVA